MYNIDLYTWLYIKIEYKQNCLINYQSTPPATTTSTTISTTTITSSTSNSSIYDNISSNSYNNDNIITIHAGENGLDFLFLTGEKIKEPAIMQGASIYNKICIL